MLKYFRKNFPPLHSECDAQNQKCTHTQKQQNTKNPYRVMAREEMTLTGKTTIVLYQTSAIKKNTDRSLLGFTLCMAHLGTAGVNEVIFGPKNKG